MPTAAASSGPAQLSRTGRIDTHHHIVPPLWAEALRARAYFGGQPIPDWSVTAALALMDELHIDVAVTSVGRPGVFFGDVVQAARLAREVNEFSAGMHREHPARFGFFASVPLPDVPAAVSEIAYAFDQLGADGIILLSNVAGQYLGDPELEPVMAELAGRNAVVFVHPTDPPGAAVPGVPPFVADFLLDTTRAALNLVRHGVITRYPTLRLILSHAGGFMPYAALRIASLAEGVGTTIDRDAFLTALQSFYFDTALSAGPFVLPSLLAFARPERVLFGSDWPYARSNNSQYFTAELDRYPLDDRLRAGIYRGNAQSLFPRLATE